MLFLDRYARTDETANVTSTIVDKIKYWTNIQSHAYYVSHAGGPRRAKRRQRTSSRSVR
jgi:hypothetical protein